MQCTVAPGKLCVCATSKCERTYARTHDERASPRVARDRELDLDPLYTSATFEHLHHSLSLPRPVSRDQSDKKLTIERYMLVRSFHAPAKGSLACYV